MMLGVARIGVVLFGALGSMSLAAACSSFSAGATPGADEAGADASTDAVSENALDAGTVDSGGQMIGSASEPIIDVRLDATRVLWMSSSSQVWMGGTGHLYAKPLSGMTAQATFFIEAQNVGSLTANGTANESFFSVVAGDDDISSLSGIETALAHVPGLSTAGLLPIRLLTRDDALYWLAPDATNSPPVTHLYTLPVGTSPDGSQARSINDLEGSQAFDLAVSSHFVYVLDPTGISATPISGGLSAMPLGAGAAASSMAISDDGNSLYWATPAGVMQCTLVESGSSVTCMNTFTSLPLTTARNVLFAQGALWVATDDSIYVCPAAGCAAMVPAPVVANRLLFESDEYRYGHSFAVSSSAIFWAENGGPGGPTLMTMPLLK